jgi:hypothetical protein
MTIDRQSDALKLEHQTRRVVMTLGSGNIPSSFPGSGELGGVCTLYV